MVTCNKYTKQGQQDVRTIENHSRLTGLLFFSFSFSQEADEHRVCGHEPVPHAANPEPPLLPPGESPPRADRAGGDQTDLPQGERDESGRTELRQRR